MAGGTDVEAGRAFVTLYLRKTGFNQQVQQAAQDTKALESQLSSPPPAQTAPQQTTTEIGITVGGIEKEAAIGAARAAGATVLSKAMTGVSTAMFGQAAASAAVAGAAPAAAAGLASTGVAAAGASTGFAAMAAAAAPIVLPLLAIAAVAAAVYVAIFKWDELPGVVKLLLVPLWPLVILCKAVKLGIDAVRLAIAVITAPFRAAAYVVRLFTSAIFAIPGACLAAVNGLLSLPGMAARASVAMAQAVGRGVATATGYLARLPGQLAAWGASAVSSVSAAIGAVGKFTAKAGAVGAALAGGIVGPLTAAAKKFADYGQAVADTSAEYDVSAQDAAVLMRAADGTGQSVYALAAQMKAGTRDFSRWRQEAAAAGQILDGPGVASAMALTQAYASLKASLSGLWVTLGSAVAPIVTESTTLMVSAVRAVTTWVAANKPLIAQVFQIASGVAVAASAVASIGGAMMGAATVMTPLTVVIGAIAGALALVEYRTGTGRGLWASYGASVQQVYATTVAYLGQMAAFVGRVFGGITDAIRGGDMKLAATVAWAGVKVAWVTGLMELDSLTQGVFGGILAPLAAGNWSAAGTGAMLALQIAWATGVEQVRKLWSSLQSWLSGTWTGFVNAADRAWVDVMNAADSILTVLQQKFDQLKTWGQSAFTEVAAKAEGLGAAIMKIGERVGLLLKGLSMISPVAGAAMLAASVALSAGGAIGSGVEEAFTTASAAAKERLKSEDQKAQDSIDKAKERKKLLLATGTAGDAETANAVQKQIDDEEAKLLAKKEQRAVEAQKRKEDREAGLRGRMGERNMGALGADAARTVADNAARIAAEENIARLKAKQKKLEATAGAAAAAAENKKQLDAATAAAAAARKAEEAKGLKPEDFAKVEKEKMAAGGAIAGGLVRFGGAGAAQAFATGNPQKKLEDLAKQQVGALVDLVKQGGEQIVVLKDVLKGWGFA